MVLFKDVTSRSLTSSRAGAHLGVISSSLLKKQRNCEKILEQNTISPALTVVQLKSRCKKAGLPQSGTKAEVLARLGWRKVDAE